MEREFYRKNGFVILKSVISPELIARMRAEVHQIISQQLITLDLLPEKESSNESLFSDMKKLHAANLDKYLASLKLCPKTLSLFEALMSPKTLKFIRDIGIELPVFQTQPVFHAMAEELRIKDGYFGVGAHQDWPALQSGLDTVTTWVPLVPVRSNTFTLEIIPQSHLLGFCESREEQNIHEIAPSVYKNAEFIKVELDPGDVLAFSVFLIHRSELEAKAGAFRLAFSMRYENASDQNFIKRNYPFSQRRVVDRALDEKAIPSREEVLSRFL